MRLWYTLGIYSILGNENHGEQKHMWFILRNKCNYTASSTHFPVRVQILLSYRGCRHSYPIVFLRGKNQINCRFILLYSGSDKQIQGIRSDKVPEELWTEFQNIVHEVVIKTIPKKKKCRKAKWLSEKALKIAKKRREAKGKGKRKDMSI